MRFIVLLAALAFVALTTYPTATEGQELPLPAPWCFFFKSIFRARGCLETENPGCQLLALFFTREWRDAKLCNEFLCEAIYDQEDTGHSCKGQLQCLITKRRSDGICPANQICCAP